MLPLQLPGQSPNCTSKSPLSKAKRVAVELAPYAGMVVPSAPATTSRGVGGLGMVWNPIYFV
jgi:hypothetical protein